MARGAVDLLCAALAAFWAYRAIRDAALDLFRPRLPRRTWGGGRRAR